jgi:hypothetical protein
MLEMADHVPGECIAERGDLERLLDTILRSVTPHGDGAGEPGQILRDSDQRHAIRERPLRRRHRRSAPDPFHVAGDRFGSMQIEYRWKAAGWLAARSILSDDRLSADWEDQDRERGVGGCRGIAMPRVLGR